MENEDGGGTREGGVGWGGVGGLKSLRGCIQQPARMYTAILELGKRNKGKPEIKLMLAFGNKIRTQNEIKKTHF